MWDQWEYHIEPMPNMPLDGVLAVLNRLGLDRWELVVMYPSEHHLLFKRKTDGKTEPR